MPLPIPNLDDRRFDDLVAEATARIEAHTPEWSNVAPGDPGAALIDLFAWLTETILYRQNLIPLRQRRAFMNLLSMPLRPAAPASGLVCVDSGPLLPTALAAGQATFTAGAVTFTSTTDLQPTPLQLVPMIKAAYVDRDPKTQENLISQLRTLYGIDQPTPFVSRSAFGADGALALSDAVDGQVWLALVVPQSLANTTTPDAVRSALAGLAAKGAALSIGLAPEVDIPGFEAFDQATSLPARTLNWSLVTQDASGSVQSIALQVQKDTSRGARNTGVALLVLPNTAQLIVPPSPPNGGDPMYAGTAGLPPELPVDVPANSVVMWLTLSCADPSSLSLAYLAVNAAAIVAQATAINEPLGVSTGASDASFTLANMPVVPSTLVIQIWPAQGLQTPATWTQVDNFGAAGQNDTFYTLDPSAGAVTFGDGIRGQRPPPGAIVVAQTYAYGGGAPGNLAAGSIKAVHPAVGSVRHEWPTTGGVDGESVTEAERRIPAFLAHRDRAVTPSDFQALALATPGLTLGRAEVVQGLMPGAEPDSTRTGVPGVVSVFVFPNQPVAFGNGPVATLAQLQDVFAYLQQRVLIGTQLFVLSAEPVPIYASVSLELLSNADSVAVTQAVQQALANYLWALSPGGPDGGGWTLGRTVAPDELLTQAARVPGVLAADEVALYTQTAAGWTSVVNVPLKPWQVPALQGVGVSSDGSGPSAPSTAGTTSSVNLVPYVPNVC
jgi:predicted phage baseplate assembly protein